MQLKNKYFNLGLVILSSCLFTAAWPDIGGLTCLAFIAFIPLLIVEYNVFSDKDKEKSRKIFWLAWLSFFLFNILTTWWIYFASPGGMILAVFFNSLFMAIVFRLFHTAHKKLGNILGYVAFVLFWVAFEYLHFNWDLSWTWLTMGNLFSVKPHWVQWYSVTGILGGSLWVLIINLVLFFLFKNILEKQRKKTIKSIVVALFIIFLPISISYFLYYNYQSNGKKVNITIVQPNIDPYHSKFNTSDIQQLQEFLSLADTKVTDSTEFIIGPETSLAEGYFENELKNQEVIKMLRAYLQKYPRCRFITGLSSFKAYPAGTKHTRTARKFSDSEGYYDAFNTSMEIDDGEPIQLYHKSRLVLGVEKIPFAGLFNSMNSLAIDLGGSVGSLGTEKHAAVFKAQNKNLLYQGDIATLICYESVYYKYCTEFVKRGAKLLFIITNDGWWGNTPGYKQHFNYARLVAISLRRSIAQSANTGRSGFIDQRGDAFKTSKWWVPTAINGEIRENDKLTFYARFGDYIGVIASAFAILLVLGAFYTKFFRRSKE